MLTSKYLKTIDLNRLSSDDTPTHCEVCKKAFAEGEKALTHPGCKHCFHLKACNPKVKLVNESDGNKKYSCPVCKLPTRIELLIADTDHSDNVSVSSKPVSILSGPLLA